MSDETKPEQTQDGQEKPAQLFDDSFVLGTPAIVCRWRLQGGKLPMHSRHLRALARRQIHGRAVSKGLVAWARTHIEWTLKEGAANYPDGVLMLIIDENQHAAMSVGPFEELDIYTLNDLFMRAINARKEAERTGIAPEVLWAVREKHMYYDLPENQCTSAMCQLTIDLLKTLGFEFTRKEHLAEMMRDKYFIPDEIFVTSDEYGILSWGVFEGEFVKKFKQSYDRLLYNHTSKK